MVPLSKTAMSSPEDLSTEQGIFSFPLLKFSPLKMLITDLSYATPSFYLVSWPMVNQSVACNEPVGAPTDSVPSSAWEEYDDITN